MKYLVVPMLLFLLACSEDIPQPEQTTEDPKNLTQALIDELTLEKDSLIGVKAGYQEQLVECLELNDIDHPDCQNIMDLKEEIGDEINFVTDQLKTAIQMRLDEIELEKKALE